MSEEREDLDLLAFRFVAGEMTADEAAAFEIRLADEQAARVAVSRAVGLSQLLASAAPSAAESPAPARKQALAWAQPLAWMAIGAACAVLAVNGFSRTAMDPHVPPPTTNVQPAPGGSPVDALVWARLQSDQEWSSADLERWLDESGPADDADELPAGSEIPSWVLAAKRTPSRPIQP